MLCFSGFELYSRWVPLKTNDWRKFLCFQVDAAKIYLFRDIEWTLSALT